MTALQKKILGFSGGRKPLLKVSKPPLILLMVATEPPLKVLS